MGAQWSLYYSYTLGEPFGIDGEIWEICPAVRKEDEQMFTVFIHDKEKEQVNEVDNAIKVGNGRCIIYKLFIRLNK